MKELIQTGPFYNFELLTKEERHRRYVHDTVCRHARACKAKIRAARIRREKPYPTTAYEGFAADMGKDWRNMTDAELKQHWGS